VTPPSTSDETSSQSLGPPSSVSGPEHTGCCSYAMKCLVQVIRPEDCMPLMVRYAIVDARYGSGVKAEGFQCGQKLNQRLTLPVPSAVRTVLVEQDPPGKETTNLLPNGPPMT